MRRCYNGKSEMGVAVCCDTDAIQLGSVDDDDTTGGATAATRRVFFVLHLQNSKSVRRKSMKSVAISCFGPFWRWR
jgi:hypothetical protein